MDAGGVARAVAPKVGLIAGAAAVGGVATWGAIRAAGESDGSGLAPLVSALVVKPFLPGAVAGIATGAIVGATPLGKRIGGIGSLLAIPAGIAGAYAGAAIARRGLEKAHPEEYGSQQALIDATMGATQEMFRQAGASEAVLSRVPERYDRSYFNASYHPPIGPFGDNILVGRSPEGGVPLGDDVITHEFSHKVIHEYAPGLLQSLSRKGDGRAIHESLADTFAMAVDTEDWTIGEDAWKGGLRSFSHPEERGAVRGGELVPAPITREQLESGTEEHLAAGVGNKAAWRIGEALGRDEMARIYVAALERGELGPSAASYADFARIVRAAAVDLHGADSREAAVVDDAWRQAGY